MKVTELFKFVLDGTAYTWTSGNEPVEHEGETYAPEPIARPGIEDTNQIQRANLKLQLPISNPLAQIYLRQIPDRQATATIFRKEDETVFALWKGRVAGTSAARQQMNLECESVYTSLRRTGARNRFQKLCRFVLYSRGCNLDRNDFKTTQEPDGADADGVAISVPAAALQPDGWFLGGMLEFDAVFRFVVRHAGSTLTLQRKIEGLNAETLTADGYGNSYGKWYGNLVVSIFPGCDRLRTTCENKFDNLDNFGGFPWIPSKNPFENSIS